MAETRNLALPLIAAAQAQKHVTVNEALLRVDALARIHVESALLTDPPAVAGDGTCYVVPPNATGVWLGHAGQVAIWSNGGWDFATPHRGWTAWNLAESQLHGFDGFAWVGLGTDLGAGGSATVNRVSENDHVILPGTSSMTVALIPAGAQVGAVTLRVIEAVNGIGVTSFSVGVTADLLRYGSGIGLALNSWGKGVTGAPVTYYDDTSLILTANAGEFASGKVRIAVHMTEVVPPRAV